MFAPDQDEATLIPPYPGAGPVPISCLCVHVDPPIQAYDYPAAGSRSRYPVRVHRTYRKPVLPLEGPARRNVTGCGALTDDRPLRGPIRRSVDAVPGISEELQARRIRHGRRRGPRREEQAFRAHNALRRRRELRCYVGWVIGNTQEVGEVDGCNAHGVIRLAPARPKAVASDDSVVSG